MNDTLMRLLVLEIVLTVAMVTLWVWRSFLDMKEDDHLVLDEAESHLERGQKAIRQRVRTLSRILLATGVAWGLLAVGIIGAFIVNELKLI